MGGRRGAATVLAVPSSAAGDETVFISRAKCEILYCGFNKDFNGITAAMALLSAGSSVAHLISDDDSGDDRPLPRRLPSSSSTISSTSHLNSPAARPSPRPRTVVSNLISDDESGDDLPLKKRLPPERPSVTGNVSHLISDDESGDERPLPQRRRLPNPSGADGRQRGAAAGRGGLVRRRKPASARTGRSGSSASSSAAANKVRADGLGGSTSRRSGAARGGSKSSRDRPGLGTRRWRGSKSSSSSSSSSGLLRSSRSSSDRFDRAAGVDYSLLDEKRERRRRRKRPKRREDWLLRPDVFSTSLTSLEPFLPWVRPTSVGVTAHGALWLFSTYGLFRAGLALPVLMFVGLLLDEVRTLDDVKGGTALNALTVAKLCHALFLVLPLPPGSRGQHNLDYLVAGIWWLVLVVVAYQAVRFGVSQAYHVEVGMAACAVGLLVALGEIAVGVLWPTVLAVCVTGVYMIARADRRRRRRRKGAGSRSRGDGGRGGSGRGGATGGNVNGDDDDDDDEGLLDDDDIDDNDDGSGARQRRRAGVGAGDDDDPLPSMEEELIVDGMHGGFDWQAAGPAHEEEVGSVTSLIKEDDAGEESKKAKVEADLDV